MEFKIRMEDNHCKGKKYQHIQNIFVAPHEPKMELKCAIKNILNHDEYRKIEK